MSDIFLLLINGILFWWCLIIVDSRHIENSYDLINIAFLFNIGLWGLFAIFGEIFISYHFEMSHGQLLILAFLSFMIIKMLPNSAY